ncbi:hypothetical protein LPA44_11125 [Halobacterium sp. KA-4]|uniref:DUF7500 family protein n=1 Tax=Halobacterium sp. KA-4 TaxID=2896367 RepID=UPI001E40DDEA|nr:hypothetical protein [Halobacterium sp. KA-4]MCD2200443.1 hypothetical protein [Halobacterium sp. KA-4]
MAPAGDADSDESVLSADELDIEAREEVASIGDDRYVIGPDGPPSTSEPTEDNDDDDERTDAREERNPDESSDDSEANATRSSGSRRVTGRDVKRWLGNELSEHNSEYAYRIAAKSGGSINHQQLATDDIGAAFDGLLVWYAQQISSGTPVDEALGILLSESSVQARYPTSRLIAYLEENDLGPDDSIRDLVDTVSEDDGLVFPRRR